MSNTKRFLLILFIGLLSSMCGPFAYLGLIFGFFPVVINTIILSLMFKKELYPDV